MNEALTLSACQVLVKLENMYFKFYTAYRIHYAGLENTHSTCIVLLHGMCRTLCK